MQIKMNYLKDMLPPNIYEIIDRAGICTPKQIVTLSTWDIRKLTGLQSKDVELLRTTVAKHMSPLSIQCNNLVHIKNDKVKSGISAIDNLLKGGFRTGVIIEIYGESGSGKTQLAMQLSANNACNGAVYICTEDLFPIKRYNQIHDSITQSTGQMGNNVFIEHVYEGLELLSCIRLRLPKLLQQHKISVIVLDSVAAPFRVETSDYIQRAEELRDLAIMLTRIAQDNNLSVICINQVTSNFDDNLSKLLPSLGLAWSNMISYRLFLKKTSNYESSHHSNNVAARELKVVFAPDLPNSSCNFHITSKGIT